MIERAEVEGRPRPRAETASLPDPEALPARYLGWHAGATEAEVFSVVLGSDSAVVRRRVGGVPMTMVIPIASFRGVAVWIPEDLDAMEFELAHPDPMMSLPLGRVADVGEAARVWRRWAEVLALPLLVIEPDGALRPVDWSPEPVPVSRPPETEPLPLGEIIPLPGRRASIGGEAIVRSFVVHSGGRVTVVPE